jgi:tRNA(Arg) A34 adenosine deaminase TadA
MAGRRQLLRYVAAFGGLSLVPGRRRRGGLQAATNDDGLMKQAFELKNAAAESGDQSYGAVVAKDGRVVGNGPSRVVVNQDPTAHAEMEAIRDAARTLGTRDLDGCIIYATSKPCRMCETAAYWANISYIYYGGALHDGGRPRYSSC